MGKLRERRSAWEIIPLRGKNALEFRHFRRKNKRKNRHLTGGMLRKLTITRENCAGKWNLVKKQAFHGKKILEKFSLVI